MVKRKELPRTVKKSSGKVKKGILGVREAWE